MPDTKLGSQPLDLTFHPHEDVVFTALLNGEIRCYSYDEEGKISIKWKLRPSKKSCRALAITPDGEKLWCGYKSGTIVIVNTSDGELVSELQKAHSAPLSRMTMLGDSLNMAASSDDDGVIKVWDTRSLLNVASPIRTYTHHSDYISGFVWLNDKKHLVATSGDGTLSVMDVRSSKSQPLAQSEDQEDEILSVIAIKGEKKLAIGTQLGPIAIFDRSKGYADCVDRFIGHPQSVDAMVALSSSRLTFDIVATGSSDGLIRVVQIHPSKFLGVIASHGTVEESDAEESKPSEGFPVERMQLNRNGKWLASISHDEVLKLTNVEDVLEDDGDGQDTEEDSEEDESGVQQTATSNEEEENANETGSQGVSNQDIPDSDKDSDAPTPTDKKRRKKQRKREEAKRRKIARDGGASNTFFNEL
ncbi:WD repeat-containing protein jip5 [Serendipita sp. 405]|nr:WD repeat-containing protein jip5 [Serendipita sp. 397]KAG8800437.1 WD repeat-containing protein jip5 [Serendipita sp. 398]KAG8868748.1 WD repeat-containing protein jip5 [Serendipita sp. 405]